MQETGKVISVNGDVAVVEFVRGAQCKNCNACITAGEKHMRVDVPNALGAAQGDIVAVNMPRKSFMRSTALLYLLPLAALLIALFVSVALTSNELIVLVACVAAVVVVLVILRLLDPVFKRSGQFSPQMTQIVNKREQVSNGKGNE